MSASASKKKRKELLLSETPAAKTEKKSNAKKIIIGIVAAVLALALIIAVGVVIKSNGYKVKYDVSQPAMTVGDYEVSVPMFNYFYSGLLNNYLNSGYLSYGLITAGTPLSQQQYMGSYGSEDGPTWEEQLIDDTKTQITNTVNLYLAAKEAGYTLTEEDKAAVEESVKAVKDSAKQNGYNFFGLTTDWFMSDYFGSGCTVANYREFAEMTQYCSGFEATKEEELKPTADAISAEYAENANNYDVVTYALTTISATSDGTDEDGNATYSDEALAQAKTDAEAALASFPEDATAATRNLSNATSYINEDAANWLFDAARAEGDVEMFGTEDGMTYYVVRFDGRDDNDYRIANAYVISFAYDTEGSTESASDFEKLTKNLENGISEEDFAARAEKLEITTSASDVDRHKTYAAEVMSFLYDSARKDGDILTLKDDASSTYYVIRFNSFSEESYRNTLVSNSLHQTAINDYLTEVYAINTATTNDDALENAYTDRTYSG